MGDVRPHWLKPMGRIGPPASEPLPILILPIFTTNETALITSAIASITLPIIAYIASPAFRRA